jgi:hypothetical protein
MSNTEAIRQQRYEQYSGLTVTLNGIPARIVGYALPYATVATWGASVARLAAEWSWDAVARIVATGGDFRM